jgi:formate-dependent nitrite reductase membrane component NrfD
MAVAVAVYTAYLFSQAEGRDLWQSPLLPFHLVVQAAMAGSGMMLIVALFLPEIPDGLVDTTVAVFFGALIVDLFVTLVGEFTIPHASEVAARAAHDISQGHYKNHFWWGSIALGHIAPLALAVVLLFGADEPLIGGIAGLCVIAGLYLFEYAFVMAPQDIPNS